MLTGTPVLGSDFGSLPEIVVPGSTGFLCHNLAQYLEGITLIEQDKVSRVEIAHYARAKYDMKVVARAYDVALQAIHDSGDYNWDGSWRP
jgi:glycosyltransferase involved in cell wall biosynthesis